MNQKKIKMKRWRKITALLLSAAMAVSYVPGTVYAAENEVVDGGNSSNGNVPSENESGGVSENAHEWEYVADENRQQITAACKNHQSESVNLTLKVEKDPENKYNVSVLADGNVLASENPLKIEYKIQYQEEGSIEWVNTAPVGNGEHKVSAVFGNEADGPRLEAGYTISHQHEWTYIKEGNKVEAICSGKEGECAAGETKKISLTLQVGKDTENRKKVSVLAGEQELPESNEWQIKYKIQYQEEGSIEWVDTAPVGNGKHKVSAVFGNEADGPRLEADYTISHQHEWTYIKEGNKVEAICSRKEGECAAGETKKISLTLQVGKDTENRKKVSVLAGEQELPESNEWQIKYKIQYQEEGSIEWVDTAPVGNGKHKVSAVFGNEADGPRLEADYTISHQHVWTYEKQGTDTITAACQGTEGLCNVGEGGKINLTLKVEKNSMNQYNAAVLVNGVELPAVNDWKIEYQIKYLDKSGIDLGTTAPEENGEYKVHAVFGASENAPYLDTNYTIAHQHEWKYEQLQNAVSVNCQGTEGKCEAETIHLTLNVIKESDYTEDPGSRVSISANGQNLDLDELGITYKFVYFTDIDGKPGDTPLQQEPRDSGTYYVRAIFGDENSENKGIIEDRFLIKKVVISSNLAVKMNNYKYKADKVEGPSLSEAIETKTITYYYYRENEENPLELKNDPSNDPGILSANTYYVSAEYTQSSNENYIYKTEKTRFQVEKADRSGVKVSIQNYDLKGKRPEPQLVGECGENPQIVYYYSKQNKTTGGIKWDAKKPEKGTYYMYAVIGETANYNGYTTPTQKFTVYADHKWNNLPKKLTSKAQKKKIQCAYCKEVKNITLPKKTINVPLGETVTLTSKECTFSLGKSAKVKKAYFTISKKGKIATKSKSKYYKSMKTSVPVTVKTYGKNYSMTVKLKIPKPKAKIKCSKITHGNISGRRFAFEYNIPGADRIQVRLAKGNMSQIKKVLDKYVSTPKSTNDSYIDLSDQFLKKLKNKVTFKIVAYYGKNKSEVLTKKISVK